MRRLCFPLSLMAAAALSRFPARVLDHFVESHRPGAYRQQKNWKLAVDSITPMQKFEQYKSTSECACLTTPACHSPRRLDAAPSLHPFGPPASRNASASLRLRLIPSQGPLASLPPIVQVLYTLYFRYQLFGIGDDGHTVFGMNHDSRAGENVEEFVIKVEAAARSSAFPCISIKYKSGPLISVP